jgi:hypothetical protein
MVKLTDKGLEKLKKNLGCFFCRNYKEGFGGSE